MADARRIAPDRLAAWSLALLTAAGVPPHEADEVVRHLLFADLRGVDTHGTSRLKVYLTRMEAGVLGRSTRTSLLKETPISAVMDGNHGLGQVMCREATDLAIAKAKAHGIGMVTVKNGNHAGCMGYYTLLMAEAGLIGFACCNTPSNMAPFGGMKAFFGTNPLSLAAPAGANRPFVFDMATTQVARGKIINAAREGKAIPEGWAITRDGLPTTDSKQALEGFLLPMGGAKGSALAYMVEILAGIMSGALIGPQLPRMLEATNAPQQVGHFFLAFRPDLFMEMDEFQRRMDETMAAVRQVPPAPGFNQVFVPGDVEALKEAENRRLGIPIAPGTAREFAELAARYGVPLPEELTV